MGTSSFRRPTVCPFVPDSDAPTLRSPRIYGLVIAITLLAIGIGVWSGVSHGRTALLVLFGAVVVTGMPHGAIDHLMAAELYGLRFTWADQAKFYGAYLVLMALYGAFWVWAPAASLIVFLGMTMYHFGQADLAYWTLPPRPARLLYLSRGLFLIGLPIAAFPALVDPIFAAIGGLRPSTWPLLATHADAVVGGLVAQHVLALGGAAAANDVDRRAGGRELLNVGVLTALFVLLPPLVAFSVYFGAWHALGHILEMLRFFRERGTEPSTLAAFYREAALFTLLPFVGLAGLYGATQSFGLQDEMVGLLFILIAVMTLPHMIIVERLYRERERQAGVVA
jgi:Brp/Blh family beta-carotene 15,15'-monooxygenase